MNDKLETSLRAIWVAVGMFLLNMITNSTKNSPQKFTVSAFIINCFRHFRRHFFYWLLAKKAVRGKNVKAVNYLVVFPTESPTSSYYSSVNRIDLRFGIPTTSDFLVEVYSRHHDGN